MQIGLAATNERRQLIRDASVYTASTYIVQILVLLLGLFTRRLLGPLDLGIWSILLILISYVSYFDLGISDAAGREIPYWKAKGDEERPERFRNLMYTYNLAISIIFGLGFLAYAFIFRRDYSPNYFVGLAVVGISLPLWRWITCGTVYLRCTKEFVFLSKTNIIVMLLNGILSLALVWRFGLNGMYGAYILQLIFNAWYWKNAKKWQRFFSVWFSKADFFFLLKIGVPIALGGLTFTVFRTLDSVLVNRNLGPASFGVYSIGVSITAFIYNLPNSFSIVMYPRFQERFGSSKDDRQSLISFIEKPTLVLNLFLLPLVVGAAFFVGPLLIRHILPKFVADIEPLKVLLVGIFFLSLIQMPGQFLITINKQLMGAMLTVACGVLLILSVTQALKSGQGLVGVAVVTAAVYFVQFLITFAYAFWHIKRYDIFWRIILRAILTGAFCFTAMFLLDSLVKGNGNSLLMDAVMSLTKALIFILLSIPFFAYAQKKTGIIGDLLSFITRNRAAG